MATITVSPETNAQLKAYAAEKGCTADEACEMLVNTAIGRISAVRKYAKKVAKAPAPKKAAKAKAAPAKKAAAPKAKRAAKVAAEATA